MRTVTPNLERSLITLSNAVELVTNVTREIAGNNVASTLNNESITLDSIRMIILKRIEFKLKEVK